ncbi:MAG: hypothetical protein P9M00_03475 [Candidatus Tritonobacter lacicola]|nr:hypothetical protein [Candidatus Tritonobacter lacicola]
MGRTERGMRDGPGPHEDSFQEETKGKGKRKEVQRLMKKESEKAAPEVEEKAAPKKKKGGRKKTVKKAASKKKAAGRKKTVKEAAPKKKAAGRKKTVKKVAPKKKAARKKAVKPAGAPTILIVGAGGQVEPVWYQYSQMPPSESSTKPGIKTKVRVGHLVSWKTDSGKERIGVVKEFRGDSANVSVGGRNELIRLVRLAIIASKKK